MFKGTPEFDRAKGTAVAAVLEAIGARFNATTWFDRTNYYETIPSDELETALRIESSRMRQALLRDEDRVPGDDGRAQRVRARRELALPGPLQADVRDGVPRAPVPPPDDRLAQRHRGRRDVAAEGVLRHLLPPEQRDRDAHRRLRGGGRPGLDRAALRRDPAVAATRSRRSTPWSRRRKASGASPCAAPDRSPGAGSRGARSRRATPTRPALAVLGNILGGGITSRLHQALVEKSLALSVTVVPWQLRDPALFSVFAPVRPGVEPSEIEAVVRQEIARVAAGSVTRGRVREGAHADRGRGHLRPRLDRPDRGLALGGDRRGRLGVVRGLPEGDPRASRPTTCSAWCSSTSTTTP